MSNIEIICNLINCNAFIFVKTYRISSLITEISHKYDGDDVYLWAAGQGLNKSIGNDRHFAHRMSSSDTSIDYALRSIDSRINERNRSNFKDLKTEIYMLLDIESFDVETICRLKHLYVRATAVGISILCISDGFEIPESLLKMSTQIQYGLLDKDETQELIANRILSLITIHNDEIDNGEIKGEKIVVSSDIDNIICSCIGLSEEQLIILCSYCLSTHNELSVEVIDEARSIIFK